MFELTDKVAVVTGGASGIGLATARRLRDAGCQVILADLTDASGIAKEIGAHYVRTDVSEDGDVERLMSEAASLFARIDICVNNAGVGRGRSIQDTSLDDMLATFRVNTCGVLFGMKHVAKYMPRGGAIVNTASIAGVIGYPTYGSYGASKFGIVGLTKVAAMEFGPLGIRVNCVCPSSVNTPQLRDDPNGQLEVAALGTASPLHRLIEPEDVAALIHFLVADDCPVISGQALVLDGGATAGVSPAIIEVTAAAAGLETTFESWGS